MPNIAWIFLLCPALSSSVNSVSSISSTAWKVSKYGVISGPYFPVLRPNTGKYGPEVTLYLDTFHAVFGEAYSELNQISKMDQFAKTVNNF